MDRAPITPAGKKKLQEELAQLKSIERPRIAQAIDEARGHGDLKENAEYHAAKEKQGLIEGRLHYVEDQLARCEVIDIEKLETSRVVFGVSVRLYDASLDKELVYRIVGDSESDLSKGDISINSPLARGLIGKEKGDMAIVLAPGGNRELEVLDIFLE